MNAATISKTDYSKNNRPLSKTSLIQWHHKNVPGSNEEKSEINCFYFLFFVQDDQRSLNQWWTVKLLPRRCVQDQDLREGNLIPSCLCLLLLFRIRGNLCNLDLESLKLIFSRKLTMDNQDLISFASPNPTQKKDGHFRAELESISFDNNNDRTVEKFKAVQNLFSTPSSDPPPHPPPRAILPSVSPNGMFSYPNTTMPNLNRYQAFSSQVRQQNLNARY